MPCTPPTEQFPPEILAMLTTAKTEIDRHVNDDGLCRYCRAAWPCKPCRLADTALGAL